MSNLQEPQSSPSPAGMLLVLLLVVAGTMTGWGFFAWERLALMLAATGLCIWLHLRPGWRGPSVEAMLLGLLIAFTAAGGFLQTALHETMVPCTLPGIARTLKRLNGYGMAIKLLQAAALLVAVSYLGWGQGWLRTALKGRFVILILIAIALRALLLFSSPDPKIDVFTMQTQGAKGLLEGKNVYALEFQPHPLLRQGAEHYGYPYPPAAFLPTFLSWLLFRDVRVAWLICDLLAALLMFRLALRANPGPKSALFRQLVTLTFLFLPRTLFVLEQSWTEPLVVVALAGFALALAGRRGCALTGGLLGLLLASKQYVLVIVPLVLKLRRCKVATWICAAATGLVLALPFALWDPRAMVDRVFIYFLKSPGRVDALSIYGGFLRLGCELPWWLVVPLWLGGVAWFTWKMPRNLPGWLFSTASVWLYFFMLGKQAFMNYFHLIACTLLLAVAASSVTGPSEPAVSGRDDAGQ